MIDGRYRYYEATCARPSIMKSPQPGWILLGGVGVVTLVTLGVGLSVAAAWFHAARSAPTLEHTFVHYSPDRRYAFPVSGDPRLLSWTHLHWDGSYAVDLFARHELPMDSPEFQAFKRRHIVAVTAGTARRVDNERGGVAVLLHGNDDKVYYFAHLQSSFVQAVSVEEAERVEAGQSLGVIGNTGRWTQYLEPHLHFSVASAEAPSPGLAPDINAADWIMRHFGLAHDLWPEASYAPHRPSGAPVAGQFEITRSFAESSNTNTTTGSPDLASVDLLPLPHRAGPHREDSHGENPLPVQVLSPLRGEVRVHRTSSLGLRVQVTNRHTDETVVVSGLYRVSVQQGDIVEQGKPLGLVEGEFNLMHFRQGQLSDPEAFF